MVLRAMCTFRALALRIPCVLPTSAEAGSRLAFCRALSTREGSGGKGGGWSKDAGKMGGSRDRGGAFKKGGGVSSGMSGAKLLSTDLKNAKSPADVLKAVEKARVAAQPLGFIAATTAVNRLGKSRSALESPGVEWLFGELERLTPVMDAQGVSNTVSGLAKMGAPLTLPLLRAVLQRSLQVNQREFKPQTIANLIWGLATLSVLPSDKLMQAMSSEAVSKAEDFSPQDISNLFWAHAKLGMSPDPLLVLALSSVVVSKAGDFNLHDISNLMWAYATLRVSPDAALVMAMLDNTCIKDLNSMQKRQLHQFFVFNSSSAHPVDVSSWADLVAKCKPENK